MNSMDADVTLAEFEVLERASSEEVSVELINGRIYVVPAPDGDHDVFAVYVGDQIRDHRSDLRLFQERGLAIPAYRSGRARPDGVVAPRDYFRNQPPWSDSAGVLMLVEITSGRERDADVDRTEKREAYAQGSIPVYLLLDRHRAEATVFWEPADGEYRHHETAKFGAPLRIPKPLDFDLDTSEFL
ncbi:Uma2 family endonuclease [Nocardia altamirensis]|uniref:Uma2 family endonuclease n=1 Tax=Nocardia altamirensis TaxID=472158 RepID=UPI0008401EDC|nr:Uma2 family endonuclease [Nocardia altamirensis]